MNLEDIKHLNLHKNNVPSFLLIKRNYLTIEKYICKDKLQAIKATVADNGEHIFVRKMLVAES